MMVYTHERKVYVPTSLYPPREPRTTFHFVRDITLFPLDGSPVNEIQQKHYFQTPLYGDSRILVVISFASFINKLLQKLLTLPIDGISSKSQIRT